MKCTGWLRDIKRDWSTENLIVSFEINEEIHPQDIEDELKEVQLDIDVKKWKQKRSLEANAYCWVLCTKMAELRECSKEDVYEEMLQHYGSFYQDEDGNYIVITLKSSIDTSKIDGHWKFYKESPDGKFKSYLMIKGSSEYNTCEMAKFLDHIIREAQADGIQTLTPSQIQMMKERWGV